MRLCQFPGFYIYIIKKYLTGVIAIAGLHPAYYRFLCMEKSVHIECNNNSDGVLQASRWQFEVKPVNPMLLGMLFPLLTSYITL